MKEKIKLEINESYIKSMVEKLKSRGVKSQENAKTILYSLGYLERLKKDENVREFCDLEIDTNDENLAVFNRVVELLGQRELPETRFRVQSELLYIESIMNSLKQCGKRAKNREDREKAKALYEKLTEIQKELKKRLKQLELKLKPQELKAEAKEFVSKAKEKISSKVNKESVKSVTITALASAMLLMMSCGGGEKDENTMPLEPPTIAESAPGWSNMYPSASNTNNNETTSAESEVDTSAEAETTEPAETETKKPSGASETETAPLESDTEVETKPEDPGEDDGFFKI